MPGKSIATYRLEVWQPLWRVHHSRFEACQFNDSGKGNGRFSPLIARTTQGKTVIYPTLYAANQHHEALGETLMRRTADTPALLGVDAVKNHKLASITVQEPLLLADLDGDWVPPVITKALAKGQDANVYPLLRTFALRLLHSQPQLAGLKWQSYQRGVPGQSAYLFVQRPGTEPPRLDPTPYDMPLDHWQVKDKLVECARLFGYTLPEILL